MCFVFLQIVFIELLSSEAVLQSLLEDVHSICCAARSVTLPRMHSSTAAASKCCQYHESILLQHTQGTLHAKFQTLSAAPILSSVSTMNTNIFVVIIRMAAASFQIFHRIVHSCDMKGCQAPVNRAYPPARMTQKLVFGLPSKSSFQRRLPCDPRWSHRVRTEGTERNKAMLGSPLPWSIGLGMSQLKWCQCLRPFLLCVTGVGQNSRVTLSGQNRERVSCR